MAFLAAIPSAIGSLLSGGGLSLGTALQAGGQILSGVAAFGAANYQAQVAKQNAEIARKNAEEASAQAQVEAQSNDNEMAAFVGQQEAANSASGVSGRSQALTRKATQRIADIDRANIIKQGENRTNAFFQQQADFTSEARAAKSSGIFGLAGGLLNGATTLAGSATSAPRSPAANRFRSDPWLTRTGQSLRVRTV